MVQAAGGLSGPDLDLFRRGVQALDARRAPLYMSPPTSSPKVHAALTAWELGAICTPAQGNKIQKGWWWIADNGCFQKGKGENGTGYPGRDKYLRWLESMEPYRDWCLFANAPDVVCHHERTLEKSQPLLEDIRSLGFPVGFVAQNGIHESAWHPWDEIDALFIGGDDAFKLSDQTANLARCARSTGKHVHVGRVSSLIRSRFAYDACHAHTMDGTYITKGLDKNLANVLMWCQQIEQQTELDLF